MLFRRIFQKKDKAIRIQNLYITCKSVAKKFELGLLWSTNCPA